MAELDVTSPLYSSRPRLKIDGQDDARLDAGLLSLSIVENEQGLYRLEMTFGNWGSMGNDLGFLYYDRQVFDFGRTVDIELGDGSTTAPAFTGQITGIEGRFIEQRPPEILILAEDKLQGLRMNRRTRSFEDVSLDDVVETIAGEHSLQAEIDIDSPQYKILSQVNQSDLALLRERARLIDAEVWVEGSKLYVQSRARKKVAALELTYKQRLHEFSVLADLAHQRTHVTVGGWDISAKEKLEVEVGQSTIQSELQGGMGGSQILNDAFGQRKETIAHLTPMSEEETRSLAETGYRTISRQFVTGKGLAEGDARLKAGSHVTINGVGDLFNGVYYVNSVHHMFAQDSGYKTRFTVERPAIGA
jgi:phage protein D